MNPIKFGDKNAQVKEMQLLLIKLLYPITADEDFGPKTLSAVTQFQIWNKIPSTGIVDDFTYNTIVSETQYTVDKASYDRIAKLHPKIKAEVLHLVKMCYKNNLRLRIVQGYRTFAEQDELYAQGRTKPGPIITKAKGGLSNHNYGLSIDFCLLHTDGSISWSELEDSNHDGKKDWMQIIDIFKNAGFSAGIDWNFRDSPHIEKTFGNSIRALLKLHNEGKVDSNGFVII